MKKLKLAIEDLQVESYGTENAPARAGTVLAHESTVHVDCSFIYTCVFHTCTVYPPCA